MSEQQEKNIIKEIIAHLNSLEEKIKLLSDNIAETEDLVTINKLDMVNLKNGLEKLKISMPEVSPDTMNKLRELESITENIGQIGRWKKIEEEIDNIKSVLRGSKQKGLDDVIAGLEFLNQKTTKLESEMKRLKTKKQAKTKNVIDKLHKRVENVEKKTSFIKHCKGCHAIMSEKASFCSRCGKKV